MTADRSPRAPSPVREIAGCLSAIRSIMNEASESRRGWVRQIGVLLRDVHMRPAAMVSPSIGQCGTEQGKIFEEMRERAMDLSPPHECLVLHTTIISWLEKQVAACDVMIEVGMTGDVSRLRATQGLLAEGRADTQRFTTEYASLVAMVRQRIEARQSRPKRRVSWPFGKKPAGDSPVSPPG